MNLEEMQNVLVDEVERIEEEEREIKRHKAELIREWDQGNRDGWVVLSSDTKDHETLDEHENGEEYEEDDDEEEEERKRRKAELIKEWDEGKRDG